MKSHIRCKQLDIFAFDTFQKLNFQVKMAQGFCLYVLILALLHNSPPVRMVSGELQYSKNEIPFTQVFTHIHTEI